MTYKYSTFSSTKKSKKFSDSKQFRKGENISDNVDLDSLTRRSKQPISLLISHMPRVLTFIWPSKSIKLQICVLICLLLLILGRITNVFVPIYNKDIVNSLSITEGNEFPKNDTVIKLRNNVEFRWDLIVIWVMLKALQGGVAGTSGIFNNTINFLWVFLQQYTTREVEIGFFSHLHKLGLRWHYQRKTGYVIRAMERGTESINYILQYTLFNLLPAILDIIIAIIYLSLSFDYVYGLIITVTLSLYLVLTFKLANWRTKSNRIMNIYDNMKRQRGMDALFNYETVKEYGNEEYERRAYAKVLQDYQRHELKFNISIAVTDQVQMIIIILGFISGCTLCAWMIVNDEGLSVGDYVLFSTYLVQVFEPLNNFGQFYKILLRRIVDMEHMFQIFEEVPETQDYPNATQLLCSAGEIEFRNVSFGYIPGKDVLRNVSFNVPAGKTVAIVGPSGGGKTSIIRLLFRYFDPVSGEIRIDGKNIKYATQKSLRSNIGIVPQESVLFNDTIKYNIEYGKIGSEFWSIINAAKAACIHDRITLFPEQYNTKVGERGMKLSGGEKQRVAIARTILKDPRIILLDEATSSLDTHTEKQIQTSLKDLCQNRTCLIIAHRLSTITHADQILVLLQGDIVERGTHLELLENPNSVYRQMWEVQVQQSSSFEKISSDETEIETESDADDGNDN